MESEVSEIVGELKTRKLSVKVPFDPTVRAGEVKKKERLGLALGLSVISTSLRF
jgi:hypothetical protein